MNDLIDRQAAIEELKKCQTYLFDMRDADKKISLESAVWVIEDMPSAQPEQQWISCNERLPEVDVKVLAFARFKGDGSWFMDISSWTGVTNHKVPKFWGYGDEMVVTHWMPLPEPPKEK